MRSILRKLDRRQTLTSVEHERLLKYIESLLADSMESYNLFYARYSAILLSDYTVYIPQFKYDMDDMINYMLYHPDIFNKIETDNLEEIFPVEFHPYIKQTLNDVNSSILKQLNELLIEASKSSKSLPSARSGNAIFKYEDANPYKEIGLKSHFERLSKYNFITRLQSHRYLKSRKAVQDKINVLAADKLGGIYTNKEKSIYYFIFLNEADIIKAQNACSVLNFALYGIPFKENQ